MNSTEDLIADFQFLFSPEERFRYLIDLGRELPAMDNSLKTEETRIHGCQSGVWIKSELRETAPPTIHFNADSDSQLVKGLVAIVMHLTNDKPPHEIIETDVKAVFEQLNLEHHLSPNRKNGLNAMVKRVKEIATGYQSTLGEAS
jgi:cysteine desulfuration protein SufE